MSTHILVTGGTGNLGSEIVKQLAAAGASVRAQARHPQKAQDVPPGIQLVAGDLAKPETLGAAMDDVDAMLLLSGMDPAQIEWQLNAINAAKRAGVRCVVKVSMLGADHHCTIPLARWHAQSEDDLAASGLEYTNLRPNFFMQNMLSYAGTIKSQGAFYGCAKDGRATTVDVRDIAAVAVVCLTQPGHHGKTYVIAGPEALTFAEQAAKLAEAVGKPVKYVDLPPETFRARLIAAGRPDWLADTITELFRSAADGKMEPHTDVIRAVTGRKPITFDEFAREHAPAFQERGTAA
jgi:uncharacterized protein YbjT (DUF2867 family)